MPVKGLPYLLHTDASAVGLGAVLAQATNQGERPLFHFSRKLTKAEKNYAGVHCDHTQWPLAVAIPHGTDQPPSNSVVSHPAALLVLCQIP